MKRLIIILLALLLIAPPTMATEIIDSGYISGSSLTKGQAKQALEDIVSLIKELVGGTAEGDLTLASDAVAIPDDAAVFTLNAESGTADDCANLTAAVRDGRVVAIAPASGDTITFKHLATGAGQLSMKDGTDLEVSDSRVYTFFIFNEGDNIWYEFGPRDLTSAVGKLPGGAASTTKTISSGSITPDSWETGVDNESAAASDDLDTIDDTNGLPLVILKQGTTGKVPTIKHGTGNIVTQDGKDLDLDDLDKRIAFMRSGSDYVEIFRSGFYSWSTSSKNSTFSALWGNTYLCDTTSGFTANVQTAVGHKGEEVEFIKTTSDSNDLTIDPNSSETVNGASTDTISGQWESKRFRSDGSNLVQVAEANKPESTPTVSLLKAGNITETLRALPTSGAISGTYIVLGDWTSTGTLTAASGTRIYIKGSFTLEHALTVTALSNGAPYNTDNCITFAGGVGPGSSCTQGTADPGGGGAGYGNGGASAVVTYGMPGGKSGGLSAVMLGGSGGGRSYYGAGAGGGGSIYIEVSDGGGYSGDVTLNESISAVGSASSAVSGYSGGGGGGGTIIIRCSGDFTLATSKKLDVSGGAAASTTNRGGGGGGGYAEAWSGGTLTNNGSFVYSGGAGANSGSSGAANSLSDTAPISLFGFCPFILIARVRRLRRNKTLERIGRAA